MPGERTVAAPLSGAEIKTALVDRFRQQLDKDCFFHRDAAYDSFTGKVSWDIALHAVDTVTAHDHVEVNHGDASVDKDELMSGEVNLDPEPPNQVRVSTGQEVPTESGKKIKYSREMAGKAK